MIICGKINLFHMTSRIRIGKDFNVLWSVFKIVNGQRQPYELEGKNVMLVLVSPYGSQAPVEGWTATGNVVQWTFRGKDQKFVGTYRLILVENAGSYGMVTVDSCDAFALVAHSCEESGGDASTVVIESIQLESEVTLAPLRGPQGEQGPAGPQGEQGPAGPSYDDTEVKNKLTELSGEYVEDAEYIRAYVDAEKKFLFGIKRDGSIEFAKGVPTPIKEYIAANILDSLSILNQTFSHSESPEYMQVVTDSEGKVIAYRDTQGVFCEKIGIKTKQIQADSLILSEQNAKEISDAMRAAGISANAPTDFSESEKLEFPIPRVAASVRLIVPKMPTSKTDDIEGFLEYNDKDGNYFKKPIILNSQGSSSMGYIRPDGSQGNLSVDFTDCKIKFGNWVAQDSFHVKKYYIDAFRGQCVVGYHLMEQVYQTHPYGEKKPYDTIIRNESVTDSLGKFKKDFNTGALCHPDGFPVVIYVNTGGEDMLYGVYAWCLKKHRDNYYCDKSNADNIILDGIISYDTLFGGNIDWTQFEIRNPKDLVDVNGNEYDGENPKELSNSDALSSEVKSKIVRLSGVKAALQSNNSRTTFEQYFLPKYYIDYLVISQVLYNIDGFQKNWIWCTWDGQHWTPTIYDVDSIFGMATVGTYVAAGSVSGLVTGNTAEYLTSLYKDEIRARYKELRDKGIFTTENITGLLNNWLERIGYDNLKNDLEKYDQTPSYRKGDLSEKWKIVSYSWNESNNDYSDTTSYKVGDKCYYKGYLVEAVADTQGNAPFSITYPNHPVVGGFFNSLQRVANWIDARLAFLDEHYEYNL